MVHTIQGFTEKWNDKTIVKFENVINDIQSGSLYNNRFLFYLTIACKM